MAAAEGMEGKTGDFDRHVQAKLVQNIHNNKEECIDNYDLEFLREKLSESETEEIAICNHLQVDTVESMAKADYLKIIGVLNRKIAMKNKEDCIIQLSKITQELSIRVRRLEDIMCRNSDF